LKKNRVAGRQKNEKVRLELSKNEQKMAKKVKNGCFLHVIWPFLSLWKWAGEAIMAALPVERARVGKARLGG
jgi:hypothetical protein